MGLRPREACSGPRCTRRFVSRSAQQDCAGRARATAVFRVETTAQASHAPDRRAWKTGIDGRNSSHARDYAIVVLSVGRTCPIRRAVAGTAQARRAQRVMPLASARHRDASWWRELERQPTSGTTDAEGSVAAWPMDGSNPVPKAMSNRRFAGILERRFLSTITFLSVRFVQSA